MLTEWAVKWGVPYGALEDLRRQFGMVDTDPQPGSQGGSESAVQNRVRLEASRKGCRLWRNNVGVMVDLRGNFVRYGLCNDSKKMNTTLKSSDLIGIRPVKITQKHVGTSIGQFMAREVKAEGWEYTGTSRERAQLRFIELVTSFGGDAAFASSEGAL